MPDQTPLTDDELRADLENGWAPHAARLAAELLAARARIDVLMSEAQADHRAIEEARNERDEAVAKRDERVDYNGRLAYLGDMGRRLLDGKTEACQWAAWFAAERDYLRTEVAKDYSAIAEKQRRDSARITTITTGRCR
jgi:hypothetical protein